MLQKIKEELKSYQCELVAVSKTKPNEMIIELYNQGQRHFGENRVQELVDKQATLPSDIYWHFIGHLQSKKVKHIAPFVHLIHAVDSWKLLEEINKRAKENDRIIDVLIQFKIAKEATKQGYESSVIFDLFENKNWKSLSNTRICGVMGMATFTNDTEQVEQEFKTLKEYFQYMKSNFFQGIDYFKEISMGMSGDYPLALRNGSTIVRIGSLLFGSRN